jgi:hypothetical protein
LSLALEHSIIVYSALPSSSLSIPLDEKEGEKEDPATGLSFHSHHCSLGEHYDCATPKVNDGEQD